MPLHYPDIALAFFAGFVCSDKPFGGQCGIKTLRLTRSLIALIKFDQGFSRKKWRHLLGDSCSTGPGSKQYTRSDGVERVRVIRVQSRFTRNRKGFQVYHSSSHCS